MKTIGLGMTDSDRSTKIAFYDSTETLEQGEKRAWIRQRIKAANDSLKRLKLPSLAGQDAYFDLCYSGMNLNRHALSKLIGHVKEGEIQTIVVARLDRLGRNLRDVIALIDIFDSYNITLISIDEQLNTSSAAGKLSFSVMRAFSEYERFARKEACLKGRLRAMKFQRSRGITRIKKP